ncbi:MAG: hypothetical protein GXX84_09365 [Acidobacteria bacterium]|nr:hypothetical protein [Acidobacteriota bacterium]
MVHEILLVIAALISLSLTALIALIVVVAYSCNLDRETSARRFLAFIQGYRYLGRDGVVFQRSSQCAIACYRMLLARYGIGRPKDDNLEHYLTPAGMSMLNLLKALKRAGLDVRGVRFSGLEQLTTTVVRQQPAVVLLLSDALLFGRLRWLFAPGWVVVRAFAWKRIQMNHWVCLDSCEPEGIVVSDPLCGRVSISAARLRRIWDGRALVAAMGGSRLQDAATGCK